MVADYDGSLGSGSVWLGVGGPRRQAWAMGGMWQVTSHVVGCFSFGLGGWALLIAFFSAGIVASLVAAASVFVVVVANVAAAAAHYASCC